MLVGLSGIALALVIRAIAFFGRSGGAIPLEVFKGELILDTVVSGGLATMEIGDPCSVDVCRSFRE